MTKCLLCEKPDELEIPGVRYCGDHRAELQTAAIESVRRQPLSSREAIIALEFASFLRPRERREL